MMVGQRLLRDTDQTDQLGTVMTIDPTQPAQPVPSVPAPVPFQPTLTGTYIGTKGLSCRDVCISHGKQCNAVALASDALVGKPEDNQMLSDMIEKEGIRVGGTEEYRGSLRVRDTVNVSNAAAVPGLWVHSDGSATAWYKGNNDLKTDC